MRGFLAFRQPLREVDARSMRSDRPSPLWLSEADVAALIDLREAIDVLERALHAEARGAAQNMVKTHVAWDGSTLHAIGATFPHAGFAGTKTWAHTQGGAAPLLILFDSHDGSVKAILEAFRLGQLRTGGISGVATRWLARPTADELALIGSGKQALMQAAAVAAVRPLRRVRVFSPTPAHRTECVARLRAEFDFAVDAADSVGEAVRDAPIITLVTRAKTAFLTPDMVARGGHINAVGAITPERAEFIPDLLARCSRVVADSVPAVRTLSRELMQYYGTGPRDWSDVVSLSTLVAQQQTRRVDADLTLFKAMGMGISDLALGIETYERAVRRNVGRRIGSES